MEETGELDPCKIDKTCAVCDSMDVILIEGWLLECQNEKCKNKWVL